MDQFRRFINQRHGLHMMTTRPAPMEHRSARGFWQAIVDFFDIRFHSNPTRC
jgi:acetoacetyl-CoA synthetase